jgi:hypothetical protein
MMTALAHLVEFEGAQDRVEVEYSASLVRRYSGNDGLSRHRQTLRASRSLHYKPARPQTKSRRSCVTEVVGLD